jgi:hypothetical protein
MYVPCFVGTLFRFSDRKIGEDTEEVTLGFASKNSGAIPDLSKGPDTKADPIQMSPLTFSKVRNQEVVSRLHVMLD